ncbi:hypothetical protein [Actinacidiphila yeochonensis]|uniref:hypothetical protein n=1 Tax=Actinacidiphila yeochonensis TaxID=89050 RepID=UPI000561E038|nr:hypothetical protein [Actinacidiphila yeochonensis]
MNVNDLTPHALDRRDAFRTTVMTVRQLRGLGLSSADVAARCRPGGPWQQVLPQVCLLHSGPPSSEERVRAALLYAGYAPDRDLPGPDTADPDGGVPDGDGSDGFWGRAAAGREVMVTGPAALALHGFAAVPPVIGLPRIDVLVPRQRRLRDVGDVVVHRDRQLPRPQDLDGLPCAPVPRALADTVAVLDDPDTVRALFSEAVRAGHCDAAAVVRELAAGRLLERPWVRRALDVLRAEDHGAAEQLLYGVVGRYRLPDPVWNVELRLPGRPPLGRADAFWPELAVAVVLDRHDDALRGRRARQHATLAELGVTVVRMAPARLREDPEGQAAVIRTALTAAADLASAAYLVVTPR